ncbi:MAG: hypothetical protein JO117_11615, partial [Verrucomicrobia bacterium]|nr:hypothetical protein [Verrucomicrobiota bacterium]
MSWKNFPARCGGAALLALAFALAASARAQTPGAATPETPAIEQTEPSCWAREVPVETKTLEVVFDTPLLRTANLSAVILAGHPAASLPSAAGEPRTLDGGRTLTLPLRLEPGRVYVVPLAADNSAAAPGPVTPAKSGAGNVAPEARARFVVFQTAGDPRPEQEPPKIVAVELRHGPAPGNNAKDALPPTQLKITFDRDMNPATHGFILTQNDEPLALSQAAYDKKARAWQATFPTHPGIVTVRLN